MKVAFWGIGLVVLGVLGVVLINLFGNIAVTNQLNYTTMKNAVEAAMYDAIDEKYIGGFCLCTDKDKTDGKYVFTSRSDYELVDIAYEDGEMICESEMKNCSILQGERRIDKQVFAESFIRRFAEMVNNNKDYRIVFQEIIEYPPKVSVSVNSKDTEYLPTDKREGYTIVNKLDSIIESWGDVQISEITPQPTPKPTSTPTPKPTSTPTPKPTSTPTTETYKITVHHYILDTTVKLYNDETITNLKKGASFTAKAQSEKKHTDGKTYTWNSKAPTASPKVTWTSTDKEKEKGVYKGEMGTKNIEVTFYYKQKTSSISSDSACKWHYNKATVTCVKTGAEDKIVYVNGNGGYDSCKDATNACVGLAKEKCTKAGYSYKTSTCAGIQKWKWKSGTNNGSFNRTCTSNVTQQCKNACNGACDYCFC